MKYILLLVMSLALLSADQFDQWNESYDALLKSSIKESTLNGIECTLVDYKSMRQSNLVDTLYKDLANLPKFTTEDKNKQLACWINYYNFLTIYTLVKNPGQKKLSDLDKPGKNVWNQDAGKIAGKTYTLDYIEHQLIRKDFKEPRIHFALVCAAASCPDLRPEAYTGTKLEEQLKDQLRIFALNAKKGIEYNEKASTLKLSSLFDWFQSDFGNVKEWLYNQKIIPKKALSFKVEYLNYDWTLNAQPGRN